MTDRYHPNVAPDYLEVPGFEDAFYLEHLRRDDAGVLHDLVRSNLAYLGMNWPYRFRTADADRYVQSAVDLQGTGTGMAYKVMQYCDYGAVSMGLVAIETNRRGTGSLSYWLDHTVVGRGYATESARAVCSQVFGQDRNRIDALYLLIRPDNERGWKVAERLGAVVLHNESTLADNPPVPHDVWMITQQGFRWR